MIERLLEGLLLLAAGMTGVILSLLLLDWLIVGIRKADEAFNSWRIRTYTEKVAPTLTEDDVSDELAAVISAAVAATMKRPMVVRRIRLFDAHGGGAWSSTGRLNIMASHHIARRKT